MKKNSTYNLRPLRTDNKIGTPGIYYDKKRNRYHATITVHTRRIHLGRFVSKNMAIKVRKNAEKLFLGMVE